MEVLSSKIACHLRELCAYPDRHPGRPGNRAATEMFARVAASCGLEVEVGEMDCLDFERGETSLEGLGVTFAIASGPYSNPCRVTGRLAVAESVEELEHGRFAGQVLLLRGEVAREPLLPKNFTYFEVPEHRRIVAALEGQQPAAVISATGRDPNLAGGLYPFPLICDGDFDIPNAFMTDVEGERLARHLGETVALSIDSRRIPAGAEHVVARARGTGPGRIVVFGHIDSWDGAPGALDNGTGVAALLGLAWLLSGHGGKRTVELVPLNGEDYYGATGEKRFERDNEDRWDDIVLGMNVDAAGWRGHGTEVSLFGCDEAQESVIRSAVARRAGIEIGEPWYQSDHGLFLLHGRPALAVVSADYMELASTITHTTADTLDKADPEKAAEVSRLLFDVILSLG